MPELGWDIAETHLQTEARELNDTQAASQQTSHILQTVIAIAILTSTILEHTKTYIQRTPSVARNVTQMAKSTITGINCTRYTKHQGILQNSKTSGNNSDQYD